MEARKYDTGHDKNSANLRAWDDYEFATLKLTHSETTDVGYIGYSTASSEALARRTAIIEASNYKVHGWNDSDMSHGHAFRFEDPFGHVFEIYYDTVKYEPTNANKSAL